MQNKLFKTKFQNTARTKNRMFATKIPTQSAPQEFHINVKSPFSKKENEFVKRNFMLMLSRHFLKKKKNFVKRKSLLICLSIYFTWNILWTKFVFKCQQRNKKVLIVYDTLLNEREKREEKLKWSKGNENRQFYSQITKRKRLEIYFCKLIYYIEIVVAFGRIKRKD